MLKRFLITIVIITAGDVQSRDLDTNQLCIWADSGRLKRGKPLKAWMPKPDACDNACGSNEISIGSTCKERGGTGQYYTHCDCRSK